MRYYCILLFLLVYTCCVAQDTMKMHDLEIDKSLLTTQDGELDYMSIFSYKGHSTWVESAGEHLFLRVEGAGTLTDGDNAPFWLSNNNYGIGSETRNKAYTRAELLGRKEFFNNSLKVHAGADILATNNIQSDFYFHQFYANLRYKALGLLIGAQERSNPFKNADLSTGGLTLSNNARPIPQVEAGFPEFVEAPHLNGYLQIQGGVSYGWFNDDNYKKRYAGDGKYAENLLYHRKYAYFKIGKRGSPTCFVFGVEMDTQWGGRFYDSNGYKFSSPTGLKDYFKVFIPMAGGGDANSTDQVNILGNLYGSWHFIFNYEADSYSIKPYYEHFYEDHSGMWFKNMPDGIYGLEFNLTNRRQLVSTVLLEYIHTKNQSGPFLFDKTANIPIQVSAGDNYYNHVDYVSLTNYGFVLGNPLLTSPVYNDKRTLFSLNTRISAFHGGFGGYLTNDLKYRALLTYSRSWGTPFIPSRHIRNQFSGLLELDYTAPLGKFYGWVFSGALAYDDSSTIVGDNSGFRLKISKLFLIK
ncbi:capsule assembly Wzi family protein [Viscerimonas tarda]